MYELSKTPKLEDALLKAKLIDEKIYEKLKTEKLRTGLSTEALIKQKGLVPEEELTKVKAQMIDVPYFDPVNTSVDAKILQRIPTATAKKHKTLPFEIKNGVLKVAMKDPLDLQLIEFIEKSTGMKVTPYISPPTSLSKVIEREYSKSMGEEVTKALKEAETEAEQKVMKEHLPNVESAEEIIKTSPVAQIVSVLLEYAVKAGASDIHIEPFEDGTRIRYRIDGVLQEKFPLPRHVHNALVARIKILAHMKIDEHRKPLDGKFKVIFGKTKTDLRVSTLPTVYGEKVVIRLLQDQQTKYTFKGLGLWGKARKAFEKNLAQTTGIILVTGPTGSGKTVTNATALTRLNKIGVNIITLEDPVEINIPGVNQVQINPKAGLTFASGLRSILRQDPNIIMVGEIRDTETAQLAIQAALTGHLVLATLHTNSAPGAIPRLVDMGVEKFLLASTINVAMAQRLPRRLCVHCKEKYEPGDDLIKELKNTLGEDRYKLGLGPNPFQEHTDTEENEPHMKEKPILYRAKGCDKCNDTGYKGRIGIYEVMEMTEALQKLALKGVSTNEIKEQAIKDGMITLVQDGYLKAMWGITTIEEVMLVADK